MPPRKLSSVRTIVAALGGPTAFTRLLGLSRQSAQNYIESNRIPARYFVRVSYALAEQGQYAPLALFGQALPRGARRSFQLRVVCS